MEIIDRFSRTLGLSDKDEDTSPAKQEEPRPEPRPIPPEPVAPPIQPPPIANPQGRNVLDFNSATRDNFMTNNNDNSKSMVKVKIKTVRPKSFDDDAKVIADSLREEVPVIVNLESTSPEHARRIIDFAMGTTYAIEGDVQQVSEYVFVCTPKTVTVTFNKEEPPRKENDFSWLTRRV